MAGEGKRILSAECLPQDGISNPHGALGEQTLARLSHTSKRRILVE